MWSAISSINYYVAFDIVTTLASTLIITSIILFVKKHVLFKFNNRKICGIIEIKNQKNKYGSKIRIIFILFSFYKKVYKNFK